jgi:prepilin-type N-terminal cleavage/methylation domain-containing protein
MGYWRKSPSFFEGAPRSTEVIRMARRLHRNNSVGHHPRGFTLVEMMIVVVIVGVLSTLAVLGYRKLVLSSHVSEATGMVNNIRVAQEAYHAETQSYANCSPDLTSATSWYPRQAVYGFVTQWGGTCSNCNPGYDISLVLPVHVDGPVIFGYATIAGAAGAGGTAIANNCALTGVTSPTTDWYAIAAEADLDGITTTHTDVCAFSWTNQVFVSEEGM